MNKKSSKIKKLHNFEKITNSNKTKKETNDISSQNMTFLKRSSSGFNIIIPRHDQKLNNQTLILLNKRDIKIKNKLMFSLPNSGNVTEIVKKEEKEENNNVIKVNTKIWKNNSPRLNNSMISKNNFLGESINEKSRNNTSKKKLEPKKCNIKNIKKNISSIPNTFFLSFLIKKLKKVIYSKHFELIKQIYFVKNKKFQKNVVSKKLGNKSKINQTSSFKNKINNNYKKENNLNHKNNLKNNNCLFLYDKLGINILGTQPSKQKKINENDLSIQKNKKLKNNVISISPKKNSNKKENQKKKMKRTNINSTEIKPKTLFNYHNNILQENSRMENKNKTINSKQNIKESKKIKKGKKGDIKYSETETHIKNNSNKTEIINQYRQYLFGKNKTIKYKLNGDIIHEKIQKDSKIENINNFQYIINTFQTIKNSFHLWKSSATKQKILNSLIYRSKLNKFLAKCKSIFIKKLLEMIKMCVLFKYFCKLKDKYYRWIIIKNLKIINNKSIRNINIPVQNMNKCDIINNININNYIYSDYNKFIKQKNNNSLVVSKLICSKNKKDDLIQDVNELRKNINIFENQTFNINFTERKQINNDYNNYILFSQSERTLHNNIKRNDENTYFKTCQVNKNNKNITIKDISDFNTKDIDRKIQSKKSYKNMIDQVNQLRMVINLVELHKAKTINLYECFNKWLILTKLNNKENNPQLLRSFSNGNDNNKEKYSKNTYSKKLKNVAFSSKKKDKIKQEADKYTPIKEIKNFRSNTAEKIPYFNYCNISNAINLKENKNNYNINSFELINGNHNNIKNNYVYHKKIINMSNLSCINNCFLDNNYFNNNITMNLTSTSFYSKNTENLNKHKFIEEKKISLKNIKRIEEREINFSLYKRNNSDDNINKLKESNIKNNNSNINNDILFNECNNTKFNNNNKVNLIKNKGIYLENFNTNERNKSCEHKKIKLDKFMNLNQKKNYNFSFSFLESKYIM